MYGRQVIFAPGFRSNGIFLGNTFKNLKDGALNQGPVDQFGRLQIYLQPASAWRLAECRPPKAAAAGCVMGLNGYG